MRQQLPHLSCIQSVHSSFRRPNNHLRLFQGPKALMEGALRRYSVLFEGATILVQVREAISLKKIPWGGWGSLQKVEYDYFATTTVPSTESRASLRVTRVASEHFSSEPAVLPACAPLGFAIYCLSRPSLSSVPLHSIHLPVVRDSQHEGENFYLDVAEVRTLVASSIVSSGDTRAPPESGSDTGGEGRRVRLVCLLGDLDLEVEFCPSHAPLPQLNPSEGRSPDRCVERHRGYVFGEHSPGVENSSALTRQGSRTSVDEGPAASGRSPARSASVSSCIAASEPPTMAGCSAFDGAAGRDGGPAGCLGAALPPPAPARARKAYGAGGSVSAPKPLRWKSGEQHVANQKHPPPWSPNTSRILKARKLIESARVGEGRIESLLSLRCVSLRTHTKCPPRRPSVRRFLNLPLFFQADLA